MTKQEYIEQWTNEFNEWLSEIIPWMLSSFEKERFAKRGQINAHPEWASNEQKYWTHEKDGNMPLVDTGELYGEVTSRDNFKKAVTGVFSGLRSTFKIPDKIDWEDQKYAKHLTGFKADFYGRKTGDHYGMHVPARDFASIDQTDIDVIVQKLIDLIKSRYT
jgi:phage gpG-like protein